LVVSSVAGLLAVPPELIELGRACRAGRFQELLRIRLPFAVPFVFGGLKVAAALSVVGAVVAEFVGADAGLGYLIQTSMAFFRTPLAFGAVVVLALGVHWQCKVTRFLPKQRTVVCAVCVRDVYPAACYSLVSTVSLFIHHVPSAQGTRDMILYKTQ
jgi:ABC-type nitrate/sulfonate/bicarbonate transport system permease component